MATTEPLTHDRLLAVLHYDPSTGKFTWRVRTSFRIMIGDEAGSMTYGYIEIGIDGVRYMAHRLAWFYMTGEWPDRQIDHRDTIRSNTRWGNLRLATNGQNVCNSGIRKNNTSGFKGVSFSKAIGRWHARIMVEGELHLLGYFDTPEQAYAVYAAKAVELHGEFARLT